MTEAPLLPPSLAVSPNIPLAEQTLEQLQQERDYWRSMANSATTWGASYAVATDFARACQTWIEIRQKDPSL